MKRLVIAVLGALLLTAAPARADVFDDNPAAASRGTGDLVVVARGADGAIYERHLEGGAWTAWKSIGGVATSGPAAAAYGDAIHVFVLGTDFAVHQNVLRAGQWSGWTPLGGQGSSAPAASVRRGNDYLDVAVRGMDNQMYFRSFVPGSGWSAWAPMGGDFSTGPALNSQDPLVVNIWGRGPDGQLFQRAWNGTAWREWEPLGGALIGAPSVISRQANHVDVFARAGDRSLWQKWWSGSTGWSGWFPVDARPLDSTPAAGSDSPDHLVLFARSGTTLLTKEWRGGVGWTDWADWGPVAPPGPPAPAPPAPPPAEDGLARLEAGLRCTPPGGRLRVTLKVRRRAGMPRALVRRVVFFVRRGPRRIDRRAPYRVRLRLNRKAGSKGRVYARVVYTRQGSKKVRHKTVSRRFVMCR